MASTAALFRRYRADPDRTVRNELVERHRWLAVVAAQRFGHRGEPMEDLVQVALLGLLKAVERYDDQRDVPFSSFAMPTVVGELRRHFRDRTWAVHVTRRAKELHLEVAGTTDALARRLQRPPRLHELAEALQATEDETLQALSAGRAYRTTPLTVHEHPDGSLVEPPALSRDHRELALAAERVALQQLLRELPPRQQKIVVLRFFGELKQAEIAREMGMSQVHVSRLLRAALRAMRLRYDDDARQAG
ncbi:MAG: SigB/SigF/SigG family RNA polymerase sigma factor [Acidimicrobiales bacterium]|nr:SigB/SigF/SigG family RNA polymerase sigma factor [Acidimicrobiales bacterium]